MNGEKRIDPVVIKPLIHGVQAIVQVGFHSDYMKQRYLLIQDKDDRGTGNGVLKSGLAGGGINKDETVLGAIYREACEELGIDIPVDSFKLFGCYQKQRIHGINDNHLYYAVINSIPESLQTNDPSEVSKVHVKTLEQIIELAHKDIIHEGSVRLLFNFLNGIRFGSLNDPVTLDGYIF